MKLNSYWLKWIAVVTMAVDHIGAVLFPAMMEFRAIGRISFPIFCFLIVEGFCHTSNIKRYLTRIGIFALISEIPYDLTFQGRFFELQSQNVFFTLFLGLLLLALIKNATGWLEKILYLLITMWVAGILHTDYSSKGILLIFLFYVLRQRFWLKLVAGTLWNLISSFIIQSFGALAMIPIALYNGEQGRKMKYFFYLFYPLHLLVLWILSRWLL